MFDSKGFRVNVYRVGNFVKTLERTKETAGKDVKVFVEQVKELI